MDLEKKNNSINEKIELYHSLTSSCTVLMRRILEENGIETLAVSGRTKDASSVSEKIKRKRYFNPETQLTDMSGIRVIVFFESQVSLVSDLIRRTFDVDEENSVDRDTILGDDRIGYRSVHFVCSLGGAPAQITRVRKYLWSKI